MLARARSDLIRYKESKTVMIQDYLVKIGKRSTDIFKTHYFVRKYPS